MPQKNERRFEDLLEDASPVISRSGSPASVITNSGEGGREGGREGEGRWVGEWEGGGELEGWRERGREGEREGGIERGIEEGREGGREPGCRQLYVGHYQPPSPSQMCQKTVPSLLPTHWSTGDSTPPPPPSTSASPRQRGQSPSPIRRPSS